jgi:enhancing lycopene biosynthesis protein 2
MADACHFTEDSFAAAVFWFIEQKRMVRAKLGPHLGQLISGEYDGLVVPGVRGGGSDLYWNAVVFNTDAWWRKLVDRSARPEEAL